MIKGITVTLYEETLTGRDSFNNEIFTETPVEVDDVLVAPASSNEVIDSTNLYGKKAVYTLAIPKGGTHDWENKKIEFFGKTWKSFGMPTEGIEANIPLRWNRKVTVERYE